MPAQAACLGLAEALVEIARRPMSISSSTLPSKKWLAPSTTACSSLTPFWVFTFSMTLTTSLTGATRSSEPWTNRPGGGAGGEEREIVAVGHGGDRDEALDLRAAHQELHADPGAERHAGDPAGAGVRVDRLRPVERRGRVRQFALAVVERALAAADAAEIEAQHREAAVHEVVDTGCRRSGCSSCRRTAGAGAARWRSARPSAWRAGSGLRCGRRDR